MISVAELKSRGNRYGTTKESWQALRMLADCLASGEPVPEHICAWFSTAVRDPKSSTLNGLGLALGVIDQGRSRVVNSFDVYQRMHELVNGQGMLREHAAQMVAGEFNCSRATALHWYRLKGGTK